VGLIYLDASALVSLVVAEARSPRVAAWFSSQEETLIVSDLVNLEVSAVISRCLRVGRLTKRQVEGALLDFDAIRANCERLSHGLGDFMLAERLIRDFATKLAAADALHLASAKTAGAALATFDARLAEAARGQGVPVAEL
jgi:uncharacterized protein